MCGPRHSASLSSRHDREGDGGSGHKCEDRKERQESGPSDLPCVNRFSCQQVAETLRLIQSGSKLPIQRARMRVRVVVPNVDGERLEEQIKSSAERVEREEKGEIWEIVCFLYEMPGFTTRGLMYYR